MKQFECIILYFLLAGNLVVTAQPVIDSLKFFQDENPISFTLTTDLGKLMSEKMKDNYLKATYAGKLPDSTFVTEEIRINARGKSRREYCYMPPLKLSFRNSTSPRLSSLNALKLVSVCQPNSRYGQLLLKEYLVYKIYNLLTAKSFLVRLAQVTYKDSKGKKKPFTQYAFFVEDVDAMAKRNRCKEWKNGTLTYDLLDREQMTMMSVFQYFIGNTDWGLINFHNLKIINSRKDSSAKPYPVPYDFDHSGVVDAEYATPSPLLSIETVSQRLYRGVPRSVNELREVFDVFEKQKEKIYDLVKGFTLLDNQTRNKMIAYFKEFYDTINKKRDVESIFIRNARK